MVNITKRIKNFFSVDVTTCLLAVCEHPSFLPMITIATLIKNVLFLRLLFCLKYLQALQSVFTSNVNNPKLMYFTEGGTKACKSIFHQS